MRAKEVSFERGRDPREVMEIGNRDLRILKKALNDENYFAPVLQSMLDGLKTGSIPENLAEKFMDEAMIYYNTKKQMSWFNWYINTSNIFWDKQQDIFFITFEMPPIENDWGGGFGRKIYCNLYETDPHLYGKVYMITSYLKTIEEGGEESEHFYETRMFYPDDEVFKFPAVVHNINVVVKTTIKSMD